MPESKKSDNHYDTLGLKKDCTEKDIKDAFLKLSKEHHPDLNSNDPIKQNKFVEIYEAYHVLSKPGRRIIYDSNLQSKEQMSRGFYAGGGLKVETDAPFYKEFRDETIWSMRDKTKENFDKNKPYYGIKGVNRVSNYWIAGGAVVVMLLGTLFHYVALKHSMTFTVSQLDSKDERVARELFKSKQAAKRNGNDLQLQLLIEKIEQDQASITNGSYKD